jgi:hypothetical protein
MKKFSVLNFKFSVGTSCAIHLQEVRMISAFLLLLPEFLSSKLFFIWNSGTQEMEMEHTRTGADPYAFPFVPSP